MEKVRNGRGFESRTHAARLNKNWLIHLADIVSSKVYGPTSRELPSVLRTSPVLCRSTPANWTNVSGERHDALESDCQQRHHGLDQSRWKKTPHGSYAIKQTPDNSNMAGRGARMNGRAVGCTDVSAVWLGILLNLETKSAIKKAIEAAVQLSFSTGESCKP